MPKKSLLLTILIVGMSIVSMITILSATEEQEFPEEITIDNKGYKPERKSPVLFTHYEHVDMYGADCTDCHHYYEDGENVWKEGDYVAKCIDCHDPVDGDGNIKNLRLSFHKNCKSCHREMVKEGNSEDAPYKKCRDCHPL